MLSTRDTIKQELQTISTALPIEKLTQLVDFAEYLKSRDEWNATQELLADADMRRDIEEGQLQAAKGEGRNWREVKQHV